MRIALARQCLPAILAAALAACGGGGSNGGGNEPLDITTATVADGVVGAAYRETITATGGAGARNFSLAAGALPAGLTLSPAGVISGTPAGPAGRSTFTVSVTDSAAMPASDSQALAIDIVEPLAITTANLPDTSVGAAYAAVIAFGGGTPPYQLSTAGTIPSGIGVAIDGTMSGTVAADARTGNFDVTVTDSSSPVLSVTQAYRIRVALDVTTTALTDASGGVAYSDGPQAQGGLPPFTWSLVSGALPAGLTGPDPATGVISGTPEPVCNATNATLEFQVVDDDAPPRSASRAGIGLAVNPATLEFKTATLPNGTVAVAYDQRIVAAGGAPPYVFSLTSGTLPIPLALSAGGRITGTPSFPGNSSFEVTVTDACQDAAARDFNLSVNNASPGRNDSIAQATSLPGNGTYSASISPSGHPNSVYDPDEDYYRVQASAASIVTIDVNAQVNGSPLDSVIEVVNSAGTVLNLCGPPAFATACVSDDEELGVQLDSFLQLRLNGASTFYIHVVDWSSNARPDKTYDLVISGIN